MYHYVAIGALAGTTVLAGVWGYQNDQRATVLNVLINEKSKLVATLEADKAAQSSRLESLEAELAVLRKAEAVRKAQEAARNAATVSDTDMQTYGTRCKTWIAEEFGDDDMPSVTKMLTEVSDAWMKDGKLVFEVSTPSRTGRTSSIYLCVVDKAKGSLFKPSAFDTHNWRRS